MPTIIATVEILVVNHAIQFNPSGTVYAHNNTPNQVVDFESDSPFAIFFKAFARMPLKPPRRRYNIAITVNRRSPDMSNDVVFASHFRQGRYRRRLNLKGNLQLGEIYWYGVAAYDPPFNIVTVDPQIIIN